MGPDEGFERLLRGETPKTPEERALGLFLQDVGGAFPAEPSLAEEAHLATIVQAAQLLADKGEPAVRSASKADGRAPHASGLPKRRRVVMKIPLMRSLAAKVVAGLVVLMSMFGGLALAGALPGGSDDGATDVVEIQDVSNEAPETEAPETEDADDQGEDADDQGEDADDQGENEDADDQGDDDQGENEDADDQGDDDQGENEDADDQGEDVNDDQGEDADDQGDHADDQGDDDQGDDDQGEQD